ncbi:MAG: hypothetical protein Q9208_006109 [Pyrenodesmia sp. 3 TL-2023]
MNPFASRNSRVSRKRAPTSVSHSSATTHLSSGASSPPKKSAKSRATILRAKIAKALSRFRSGKASSNIRNGPRLTGDPCLGERDRVNPGNGSGRENEEVPISAEQAKAGQTTSMISLEQAQNSIRRSSQAVPNAAEVLRNGSVVQQVSDAYLALIGQSRQDIEQDQASSSGGAPSYTTSPHPSNPQTPVTPTFPSSSNVHDFAARTSPSNSNKHRTEHLKAGLQP